MDKNHLDYIVLISNETAYIEICRKSLEQMYELFVLDPDLVTLQSCLIKVPDCIIIDFRTDQKIKESFLCQLLEDPKYTNVGIILLVSQLDQALTYCTRRQHIKLVILDSEFKDNLVSAVSNTIIESRLDNQLIMQLDYQKSAATINPATGLNNRGYFISQIEGLINRYELNNQGFILAAVNIDVHKRFTELNNHLTYLTRIKLASQTIKNFLHSDDFLSFYANNLLLIAFIYNPSLDWPTHLNIIKNIHAEISQTLKYIDENNSPQTMKRHNENIAIGVNRYDSVMSYPILLGNAMKALDYAADNCSNGIAYYDSNTQTIELL